LHDESDYSDKFRHECECRYWLDKTGGSPLAVAEVMEAIRKKRGQAAADRLREGMRAGYKEWVKHREAKA
jgi:hypothetical protein